MWLVATGLENIGLEYQAGGCHMWMWMQLEGDHLRLQSLFSDNFNLLSEEAIVEGQISVRMGKKDVAAL